MKKEDFLLNNSGIKELDGVSHSYIEAVYDRVTSNEIKMSDSQSSTDGPKIKSNERGRFGSMLNLLGLKSKRKEDEEEVCRC